MSSICDNLIKNYGSYLSLEMRDFIRDQYDTDWVNKPKVYELACYIFMYHDNACQQLTMVKCLSMVLESIQSVADCYSDCGYGIITNISTPLTGSPKKVREEAHELCVLLDVREYIKCDFDTRFCEELADTILSGLYDKDMIYLTSLWMAYKMARYKLSFCR